MTLRARALELREAPSVSTYELDELWADCAPVAADAILGSWSGSDFATGHPVHEMLIGSRWHGKRFESVAKAHPLICRGEDGELFSDRELGKGLASLWNIEFRGEVTAAMVYDGQPVIDHFKAVDDAMLLGVMNGKGVLHEGQHYWFLLERE